MRRLIVMRHAKSSWASAATKDHDRPLNDRGRRDAPRIAQRLVDMGWAPECILSSSAQRTRETADGINSVMDEPIPVELLDSLYLAGFSEVVADVGIVPEDCGTLLILGHNPGWEGVVHTLCGEYVTMKTAAAALLEGDGATWIDALSARGDWRLVDVLLPREL